MTLNNSQEKKCRYTPQKLILKLLMISEYRFLEPSCSDRFHQYNTFKQSSGFLSVYWPRHIVVVHLVWKLLSDGYLLQKVMMIRPYKTNRRQ